jgi:hypothetical protein
MLDPGAAHRAAYALKHQSPNRRRLHHSLAADVCGAGWLSVGARVLVAAKRVPAWGRVVRRA